MRRSCVRRRDNRRLLLTHGGMGRKAGRCFTSAHRAPPLPLSERFVQVSLVRRDMVMLQRPEASSAAALRVSTSARSRWHQATEIMLLTSFMKSRLRKSTVLHREAKAHKSHSMYMEKLRKGVRGISMLDGSDAVLKIRAKKIGSAVAHNITAGKVITTVEDEAVLNSSSCGSKAT